MPPPAPPNPSYPPYAAPPNWQPPPPPYGAPPGPPTAGWHAVGGYPQPHGYPRPRNTNGFCIAALVCSLVGIIVWFLGPLLGIIFGAVGLRQTARLGESGRGLAIAGIVVGSLVMLINIAAVVSLATGHSDTSSGVSV